MTCEAGYNPQRSWQLREYEIVMSAMHENIMHLWMNKNFSWYLLFCYSKISVIIYTSSFLMPFFFPKSYKYTTL